MSIPTSTLRTSLLHAALFTATAASGAEVMFNTPALSTSEVTTPANWVGGVFPGTGDIAAWKTDVDTVTAGNQESRGGTVTVASPVSWLGLRHEDSVGALTLTGSDITLGASGITEVRWENLTIGNNVVLGATQTWTATTTVTTTGVISGPFGLTKSGSGTLAPAATNTYSGPTAVAQGTLIATSLNNVSGGTASSTLGAPTTVADGTIALGGAGNQGVLTYRGLGETTDRVVNLSGTTGGATINAETGGLLKFSSALTATGAGAKGVTLAGGGLGELSGIPSNGGLTNLTKSGVGKWTFTGASTQTLGAVNMTGGTLAYTSTASKTDGPINRASAATGVLEIATGASIVTSTANTNGILGGWATVNKSAFAVANGASPITGLATYTPDTWAAGTNTAVTLAGADPASGATTHSLRFNEAGSKTLTLAGTNAITSNGILITSAVGANPTTITGGTIATTNTLNPGGSGSFNGSVVVHQHNTAADVTLASIVSNAVTSAARTGSTTSGTAVVTGLSSTTDLVVGMAVTGTGIAANSTISSINSATQITLSANTTATGTPSLTFGVTANPFVKAGAGTLVLTGANTYTGATNINEGTLKVDAFGSAKIYNISPLGTLQLGYNTGNSVYNHGVNVNSAGAAATTGLYLKGGFSYTLQSGLNILNAPATIRTVPGTGTVTLAGWDTNGTHLSVPAAASGTVLDQDISFVPGSYGYVMNIVAGVANATGDVTLQGALTGASNGNSTHYRKVGTGSLRITGPGTNTCIVDVRDGRLILSGGDDRIGAGAPLYLGNGTTSGKLILEGISQHVSNLMTVGTGTANIVVGGSVTPSTLTVNYSGAGQTFGGTIGGTGTNENNLAFGKGGTGTYTLTGTNTYTGGTTISEGVLALGSAGAIGTTGTISLNGGTLQFSATNTTDYSSRIRIEDTATSTIDTNGQNITLASTLQLGTTGDGALTKAGAGTLTVGGSNNYSGTTTVNAGTLKLDYTASNTSKLHNNAPLKLGGGSIELAGGSHLELVDSTEISATGSVTISRTSGSSVLNLGNIFRTSTGSLDLSAPGIARTSLTNDGTGKLPAWITVAGQPASVDIATGNIIAFSGFANINRLGGKLPNNTNSNVRIVDGGTSGDITPLVAGTFNISTLLQNATAGPATITMAAADTMRLGGEGAIIVPAASGALTIQGGALTAGGSDDVPGEIAMDADKNVSITSDILDNGFGAVLLTKSGTGSLSLSGSNAHTGGTALTEGVLNVNSNFAAGLGNVTISGGSLDNTSGAPIDVTDALTQFWDGDFSFVGTNDLSFSLSNATINANRAVTVTAGQFGIGTLTGGFTLTKNGLGTLYIGSSAITGTTTVNDGVLEIQGRTGDAPYVITPTGTLKIGYTTGGGYANSNLKINGAGTAATTGLYLEGGTTYNGAGVIQLLTAPTTIRQFGTGNAGIGQFDINANALTVAAVASGSVIDTQVEFVSRGYGMSVDIATGSATATGDLVMNGPLNINQPTFGLYKRGAGSIALNAPATSVNAGVKILAGSVITGVDNALGENAILPISSGAKLVLNGHNQAAADLSGAGSVTNASATPVALTIKQVTDQTFSGVLGGAGANDANFALVKTGTAKLTLAGANNYIGNTTVGEGTLSVGTPFFADSSDVILGATGTLDLGTGATDVVDQLIVDGATQAPGIYGALGSGAQFERAYITGTGKLSVTTGATGDYSSWETANGIAGAGSGTDSDADGISNGIEFVIGGDPSGPNSDSSSLLPTITTDATYINFVFRRTDAAAAYNPYAQYGSTLGGWTKAEPGVNGVVITEENDAFGAGTDRITVKIPKTLAASGKLFAQLRIDIP